MHKIWRYLWITLTAFIGLILLLVLLLFILSQTEINHFKETIETQVTELTGRQLRLDGNLQLELSMHPALSIEKASYANAPWSDRPQMLSLDKLYLKIDLLPLFDKKLVVEQLLLEGVELSVETDADGRINWQLEKFSSTEENTDLNTVKSKSFELPFLPILKQVAFDSVRFRYTDSASDIHTDVTVENLLLANPGIDEAINFSANGAINEHPFLFSGETSFLTTVTTQNIADQGLIVKIEADALGVTLNADGEIDDPAAAQGIDVTIRLKADDLDKTFTAVTGQSIYRYLRQSRKPLTLGFSARLKDLAGGYALSKIDFNLSDNDLSGDLTFFDHPDRPEIIARLSSRNIDLNQLLPEKTRTGDQTNNQSTRKKITAGSAGITLPETALPFDLLRSLDADVNLTIEKFHVDDFTPREIKLIATLKDGLLNVNKLNLKLDKSPIQSSFTINSRTTPPRVNTKLDINNLSLGIISQRLKLDQVKAGTLQSKINLTTKGNNIKSLIMGLKGAADIQLSDVSLEQEIKGKTHKADITRIALDFSSIDEPLKYNLSGKIDDEPVSLSGELDSPASILSNEVLSLKLKLATLDIELNADGNIINPLDADHVQLKLMVSIPDPKVSTRKLSRFLPGIKINDNLAALPITINGLLAVSTGTYRFDQMQLNAGDNDLSGSLFVDLRGARPYVHARLESQLIDLNELVPATILEDSNTVQSAATQSATSPGKARLFSSKPLPAFEVLDNLDINLVYNLKKLTSNKQIIDNIYLNLALKDSQLKLDPLSIVFSRGTIDSKLELSNKDKPRFKLDTKISKLDYGQLMTILGIHEYAKGKLDAEINLTGEGKSISDLMASLNGMVRVTTVDGVLDNDSLKLLSSDLVSIIPFTDSSDRQKINCGVVQFDIKDGIASTHSMVVNTGAISALGTGKIDLANETLSLYIAPRSKRTSVIKIALVPVNITGPLNSPSVTPDIAGSTISTTRTATNIGLTIATSGLWLLAEGFTNELWDKFIDDTNYCAKALAGDKIVPTRIRLEKTDNDEYGLEDDSDDGYETYSTTDDDDW